MASIQLDPSLLDGIKGKTIVVTGAVGGIGLKIVHLYVSHEANVVMANLKRTTSIAKSFIASLPDPSHVIFVPANIIIWIKMK